MDIEYKANQDYAQAISTVFSNYIDGLWNTEFTLGQAIISNPSIDSDKAEQYLNDALPFQALVTRLSWINADGIVIASTCRNLRGISLADKEYIRSITDGEEKYISPIVEEKLDGNVIMPVTRAILKDGELAGIIEAAIDVNKIDLILPDVEKYEDYVFGIIDKNSMVVYMSGTQNIPLRMRAINRGFPGISSLNGYTVRLNNWTSQYDGIKRMGVSIPIKHIGWECFTALPMSEVAKESIYGMRLNIIVLILVIVCFAVALTLFEDLFLKPIMVLKNASDEISYGNLSARTNIEGSDELASTCMAFDRMAERTQKLEDSRQLFFRTSVHELRNPMTSIKGIASLLHMRAVEGKPLGESIELISILENEADRLSELLNEIIEAFRAKKEDLKLKTSYGRVDMRGIVSQALNPFKVSQIGRKFNLKQDSDTPLWVMGDPERLEDVVRNLIGNALKYSPEGTDVDINVSKIKGYGLISVRDRGIGIPENQLGRIFESFFRSDNIASNDPGGMGLGLYICKDIILRHGGNIWAENNTDGGSTFYVKLPLIDDIKSDIKGRGKVDKIYVLMNKGNKDIGKGV